MRSEVETITPQRAHELIDGSVEQRQRTLNKERVARLTRAIEKGQWQVTHQGIAIDTNGKVIDGNHRLHAIIAANTPVEILVSYDVAPEAFHTIDTGKARTPGDSVQIAGYGNANQVAAAARLMMAYDIAVDGRSALSTTTRQLTTEDVLQELEGPRGDLIKQSLLDAGAIGAALGRNGIRSWMTAAIALIRESGASESLLQEFMDRLKDGVMLRPDSPILSLRRYLTGENGYWRIAQSYRPTAGIQGTLKAWNAYVNGESLNVIRYAVNAERIVRPNSHLIDTPELAQAPEAQQIAIDGEVTTLTA